MSDIESSKYATEFGLISMSKNWSVFAIWAKRVIWTNRSCKCASGHTSPAIWRGWQCCEANAQVWWWSKEICHKRWYRGHKRAREEKNLKNTSLQQKFEIILFCSGVLTSFRLHLNPPFKSCMDRYLTQMCIPHIQYLR